MFWGVLGFWLRHNTKLSVVEVSAGLTLAAGLLLPSLLQEGWIVASICTCVSYATMSSAKRITTYPEIMMVSALCALVVYYGQNMLVGVGGRLGTFAALSVLLFNMAKNKIKRSDNYDQPNSIS